MQTFNVNLNSSLLKMPLRNSFVRSNFELMNQTASNIVTIRKKMRISQKEIADEYGIDQNGISRLERGERKVEAELLIYLSDKFNMSIDDIINYHISSDKNISKSNIVYEDQEGSKDKRLIMKQFEYNELLLKSSQNLITSLEEQNRELKEELRKCREGKE